jgi:hypothetical protein
MKTQSAPERALKTIGAFQKEAHGSLTMTGGHFSEIIAAVMMQFAGDDEYAVISRTRGKELELMEGPNRSQAEIIDAKNLDQWKPALDDDNFRYAERNDGTMVKKKYGSWIMIPVTIKKEIFLAVVFARRRGRFSGQEIETAKFLGSFFTGALKDIRSRNKKTGGISEETRHRSLLRTQTALERKQKPFPGFFQAIDYSACTGSDLGQTFRSGENTLVACVFDITADDTNRQIGLVYLDTWLSILSQTTLDLRSMIARLNGDMVQRIAECYASAALIRYNTTGAQVELAGTGNTKAFYFNHETMSVSLYTFGPAAGIMNELTIPSHVLSVKPGDIFCLCTDGLTETRKANGELFGADALGEIIKKHYFLGPEDLAAKILKTVTESDASQENKDDRTLQVLKIE